MYIFQFKIDIYIFSDQVDVVVSIIGTGSKDVTSENP